MNESLMLWVGFSAFVLIMLFLDLFVFHRKTHEVTIKEAIIWSVIWISLALVFNYGVYLWFGQEKAMEFLTAYVIEKSLSVDNLFVFIMIFSFFHVKAGWSWRMELNHRPAVYETAALPTELRQH